MSALGVNTGRQLATGAKTKAALECTEFAEFTRCSGERGTYLPFQARLMIGFVCSSPGPAPQNINGKLNSGQFRAFLQLLIVAAIDIPHSYIHTNTHTHNRTPTRTHKHTPNQPQTLYPATDLTLPDIVTDSHVFIACFITSFLII